MTPVLLLVFLAPLLICCNAQEKPVDCSDIFKQWSQSGVYTIYPSVDHCGNPVYCDMETDGGPWTVFQRRMDGTVNFDRPWDRYVVGFGNVNGEYWLGLEFIHKITARENQELLVEMEDFEGNNASARYSSFYVAPEDEGYKLTVSGFNGAAGDSLSLHNNMKFSTFDKDQDTNQEKNCAVTHSGGFWYHSCFSANPNGVYGDDSYAAGVNWNTWKGFAYSLKSFSMKTRPVK